MSQFVFTYFTECLPREDMMASTRPNVRCNFIMGQQELCPTTGKLHFQGYVQFEQQIKLDCNVPPRLKALFGAHEICGFARSAHGSLADNRKYTGKEASAVPDTYVELGVPRSYTQGKRTDIDHLVVLAQEGKSWDDIYETHPGGALKYEKLVKKAIAIHDRKNMIKQPTREVEVYYIWGPTGTGKSHWVQDDSGANGVPGDCMKPLMAAPMIWFEGYEDHSAIWLDDLTANSYSRDTLLHLLDKYPLQVSVKGTSTWARWTKVYITSNDAPTILSPELQRRLTHVIHLDKQYQNAGCKAPP